MKLELSLHASSLKNVAGALRGTSDPFAVITRLATEPGSQAEVIGQTEVIKNSLSPQWVHLVPLDYELGTPFKFAVTIFDENTKRKNKTMGSAAFEVGEILGSRGCTKAKRLKNGGTLYALVRKVKGSGDFNLKMKGATLKNCEGLFRKSDPFFEISKKANSGGSLSWDNVYRSEHVPNNLNPNWKEATISIASLCGGNLNHRLKITVFDHESSGKHVLMGTIETSVNGLTNIAELQLKKKNKKTGSLIIEKALVSGDTAGENASIMEAMAQMSVEQPPIQGNVGGHSGQPGTSAGTPADNQGLPGGTAGHPEGGSPAQPGTGNAFTPAMMTGAALVGAAALVGGAAMMYGKKKPAQTNKLNPNPTNNFNPAPTNNFNPAPLNNFNPAPTNNFNPAPTNNLDSFFIDYIKGGCDINVAVAIDFTGSNGDPRLPHTLHYLGNGDPNYYNDYQKAISAVLDILSKYDSDKMFPVYGFGAKYGGIVRHCFQCGEQLELHGINGVIEAYKRTFQSGLVMSGPTVFTEVIDTVAANAQQSFFNAQRQGRQTYTVLLILTDGAVSDVNATAAAISRASHAPLSIVIIGIGNADFGPMQFLDDFNSAQFGGQGRDIVQFVQFNRHAHSCVALTSETLDEIPGQLSAYFQGNGIQPGRGLTQGPSSMQIEQADEEINLSLDIGSSGEMFVRSGGNDFVDGFNAR